MERLDHKDDGNDNQTHRTSPLLFHFIRREDKVFIEHLVQAKDWKSFDWDKSQLSLELFKEET